MTAPQDAPKRGGSSKRKPSWEAVARVLAGRMHHHAFCADHSVSEEKENCPFCQDRMAYQVFTDKLGRDPWAEPMGGRTEGRRRR